MAGMYLMNSRSQTWFPKRGPESSLCQAPALYSTKKVQEKFVEKYLDAPNSCIGVVEKR